ncbi:hypothetical protein [Streptomyces sp. NPDC002889]|uniref:hypothetical protein n=1 Tax=Streptomyces sp. NPDC002889 TaxID=3364669 RepID=UPI0036AD9145
MANIFHKALMDPGARLMVGGADDIGFEELMEAWDRLARLHRDDRTHPRSPPRRRLEGDDLLTQSPVAGGPRDW